MTIYKVYAGWKGTEWTMAKEYYLTRKNALNAVDRLKAMFGNCCLLTIERSNGVEVLINSEEF